MRIVRNPSGKILLDPQQKQMGRGLYLCLKRACVEKAKSNHLIHQIFHRDVPESLYLEMAEYVQQSQKCSFEPLLGFAARSRNLIFGVNAVQDGLRKGTVHMVVIDPSASASTRQRMTSLSRRMKIPYLFYSGKGSFEKIIGKANCRCAGVIDHQFAQSLKAIDPSIK